MSEFGIKKHSLSNELIEEINNTPAMIAADTILYNGLITFNNSNRSVEISQGGIISRNGGVTWLGGQTFNCANLGNNDWGLFLKGTELSVENYQANVSISKKDSIVLARFTFTNGFFAGVPYCISDYVFENTVYKKFTENIAEVTASDNALYSGVININNITNIITILGGGVLNRKGTYVNLHGATFDFSSLYNGDYGLFVERGSTTLTTSLYFQNVSESKKCNYCLMRFQIQNGDINKIWYSISDYQINGKLYKRYSAENERVSSITYCQIGDSISWIADGKKENFTSSETGTGYRGEGGYGQKICKHFGISYSNHKSHGLNGRTFAGYMNEIHAPVNSDLIWNVPKDADVYTVFLGTNDFGTACPLGTKLDYLNDTLDYNNFGSTMTVYGGIRKMIDYISDTSTTTKDKKIVFITPLGFGSYNGYGGIVSTWQYDDNGEIIEKPNSAGWKMSQLVDAIKWVATQTGSYVIDLYNEQGIFQKNRLNIEGNLDANGVPLVYQGVLYDNLHPVGNGHLTMAKHIISGLEKVIVEDNF
ncbi:MAG: hypothetical protein RLZZ292_385 [Bacteroidota bacterium]|jgi:hypothetical protein